MPSPAALAAAGPAARRAVDLAGRGLWRSLISLLLESFFRLNPFGDGVWAVFSLDTWNSLFTSANNAVIVRTVGMAAAVTVASIAIAFPLAYYMARTPRRASRRYWSSWCSFPSGRRIWSGLFLEKLILAADGIINWFVERLGLEGALNAFLGAPVRRRVTVHFDLRAVRLRLHMAALHDPPHPCLAGRCPDPIYASADLGADNPDFSEGDLADGHSRGGRGLYFHLLAHAR